jgi:hypothetical protein
VVARTKLNRLLLRAQYMTPKSKKVVGLLSVIVLLVGVAAAWHYTHLAKNPLVATSGNGNHASQKSVGDFDQFQQDLADRVLQRYGGGKDFSVIVATTAYPLGTLLRSTGSVPADIDDCIPIPLPRPFSAQHLFPSYTMSSDTALAANLGSGALRGLDSAGVILKQSQDVHYTIADAQIQIMDDKSVERVTNQGSCGKYISDHPGMRLIRGMVLGKMSFTVKVENPATVKAQLAKMGGFSISDNPGSSTVSVADNESQPILELLSEFGNEPNGSIAIAHPTPKPVEAPRVADRSPASIEPPPPHLYIQMDVKDSEASGANMVQLLRTGWPSADIESKVQRIPTLKMPDTAQVRYFNESDLAIANRCLAILQRVYPEALIVRVGLPSPKGQLEVWLPKVKLPGGQ